MVQYGIEKAVEDLEVDLKGNKQVSECIICLTDFENEETIIKLSCNETHIFHEECLKGWVQTNYTCPLCREPIVNTPSIIERIKMMTRAQAIAGLGDEEN